MSATVPSPRIVAQERSWRGWLRVGNPPPGALPPVGLDSSRLNSVRTSPLRSRPWPPPWLSHSIAWTGSSIDVVALGGQVGCNSQQSPSKRKTSPMASRSRSVDGMVLGEESGGRRTASCCRSGWNRSRRGWVRAGEGPGVVTSSANLQSAPGTRAEGPPAWPGVPLPCPDGIVGFGCLGSCLPSRELRRGDHHGARAVAEAQIVFSEPQLRNFSNSLFETVLC
jgi:hypothetical protein